MDLWHKRLGHPSPKVLRQILDLCNASIKRNDKFSFCEVCKFGKSHCLPFPSSASRALKVLELTHTDLWGPSPIQSINGLNYYIAFLDDYYRYTWIFPLKIKGDAFAVFKQFKTQVENQHDTTIKTLRCDGGGEFKPIIHFSRENCIEIQIYCPYTSAQNGRVEQKHWHVVEIDLALLVQVKMPLHYWWEAFFTTVFFINRMSSPRINGKSSYYLLKHQQPDYKAPRTFGTTWYPCLRSYQQHKFEFYTKKMCFPWLCRQLQRV